MNRPLIVGLAAMLLTAAARPQDSDPEDAPEGGPEAKFQAIDRNGDGALSRDEFLAPARDKDYFDDVKRNFAIYDADEDGSLAPDEFEQTPAVRGQRGPGRVADPIAELAAAAADRFDGWLAESDANGDGRLDETEFSDLERGVDGRRPMGGRIRRLGPRRGGVSLRRGSSARGPDRVRGAERRWRPGAGRLGSPRSQPRVSQTRSERRRADRT